MGKRIEFFFQKIQPSYGLFLRSRLSIYIDRIISFNFTYFEDLS
jgi:hypothetical protein